MTEMFSDTLYLPAMALALLAWLVPKFLSMVFPEGVKPLLALTFVATLLLFVISVLFFVLLYLWQGVSLADLSVLGWWENITFFGRLGLISGLIWAPIMILSVASLPRTWKKEVW